MERRNFLKKLGLGVAISSLPIKSSAKEPNKTFSFDELFYKPYEGNKDLVYVKNESFLARKIYDTKAVNENFKSEFLTGTYYPVRDVYVELKEEYTEADFNGLFAYLINRSDWQKLIPFENTVVGKSPMRFVINKNGYMQSEFLADFKY